MPENKDKFPLPYDVSELTPHEPPILMVETINSVDDDAEAAVIGLTISEDNPFLDADGILEREALIEIMAQAAAAQDGYNSIRKGLPPSSKGFLVGASKLEVEQDAKKGDELEVAVALGPEFDALSVVFCEVRGKNGKVASAELTVWKEPTKP